MSRRSLREVLLEIDGIIVREWEGVRENPPLLRNHIMLTKAA